MSETRIQLDADRRALATKNIQDMGLALSFIANPLQQGDTVEADAACSALRLLEYRLADLGNILGIETDSARDIEERTHRLRAANQRIRDLEAQLGQAQAPELTQLTLQHLENKVRGWWRREGFGHVSEMRFVGSGAEITFCCHLFGSASSLLSRTPVSDKSRKEQWHDQLRALGYTLSTDQRDVELVDNDANRDLLRHHFAQHLPSAWVRQFENRGDRSGKIVLNEVKVWAPNLAELAALPVTPEDAD